MFWNDWLRHLEQLPAKSLEWEGAAAFVARIDEMQAELEQSRTRLLAAWAAMATECHEELLFFEADDIRAAAGSAATSITTLASIEQLRESMLLLRQIRQLPEAVYSEAKTRRARLAEQELVVSTLIQQIRECLRREGEGAVEEPPEVAWSEATHERELGLKHEPAAEPVAGVPGVAETAERAASIPTDGSAPPSTVASGKSQAPPAQATRLAPSKKEELKRSRRQRHKRLERQRAKHDGQDDQTSSQLFRRTGGKNLIDVLADEEKCERAESLGASVASSLLSTSAPRISPPLPLSLQPMSELMPSMISETLARLPAVEAPPGELTERSPEPEPQVTAPAGSSDTPVVSQAVETIPVVVPVPTLAPLPHLTPPVGTVSPEAVGGDGTASDVPPAALAEPPVAEPGREDVTRLSQWLGEADYAAAYWWLRSRTAAGESTPLPAWLPAALHAATRLKQGNSLAVADELGPLAAENLPPDDDVSQLLAVAAALMPALTQTRVDVKHWLEGVPKSLPRVRELVDAVHSFSEHGHSLRPEDIGSRLSVDQAEEAIGRHVAETKDWLESASHRKAIYQRASQVWHHLVKPGHELGSWLTSVANDSREEATIKNVAEAIETWSERSHIIRHVHYWDNQFTKGRKDPIVGPALEQLVAWTLEGCDKAHRWVLSVRSLKRTQSPRGWLDTQVETLKRRVSETAPGAILELKALLSADDRLLAAAGQVAWRAARELARFFSLDEPPAESPVSQRGESTPESRREPSASLHLTHRLLLLPEIELLDDGRPSAAALPHVARKLETAARERRSARSALELWLERRDFRFTKLLFESLDVTDADESLWQLRNDRLETAREELKSRLRVLENHIQSKVVDGVLNDETRAKCQQDLSELRPDECLDFPAAWGICDVVESTLSDACEKHCQVQRERWNANRESLLKGQTGELRNLITRRVVDALDRRDFRIVHEYLSRLESALIDGVPLTLTDPLRDDADEVDFIPRHDQILEAMQPVRGGKLDSKSAIFSRSGDELPTFQLESANKAWHAWRRLAMRPLVSIDALTRSCILTLCEFLGLEPFESEGVSDIELLGKDKVWAHVRIAASDRQSSSTPQFGSDRQNSYDVLCLWREASFSPPGLASRVREAKLEHRPILLWCFGGLSLSQRTNLGRTLLKERLAVLVLDEVLLGWLLGQRENRWPLFQRAALPFSAINPYKPSGVIPREIFFGRETMLQSILDFTGSGSCLVYGGRQLGKSSLLRRAQKIFHNPDRQQFAILEEIRHLGDPLTDSPASLIWTVLRDELKREFFASKVLAETPEALMRHIRDRLDQDLSTRLLILLDEADNFLDHDAAKNFEYVSILKNLVEQTDRRVKFVFAGTKNVQRFHGIPNQPLANLGTTLEIGPLEPLAAMRLVQTPLRNAGFTFQDEALILKILSYTNYHPALIQYVCFHLLAALHEQPRLRPPPTVVADAVVEQVCTRRETQKYIRDRFNLTLQLDERFRAIVWTMMDEQIGHIGTLSQVYTTSELLDRVRIWWPAAFQQMIFERFRDLLDELCGLGVLLRVAGGYRFRSPNVMHLIGDVEEIRGYLAGLDQRRPPSVFRSDSHRMLLGKTARRSPLTVAQCRQLGKREFGSGLIYGSRALGWDDLPVACAQLLAGGSPPDEALEVVASAPTGNADWEAWLRNFVESHEHCQRLIVLAAVSGSGAEIESVVRQSMEFCRRRERSERKWMRVLLRLDPTATWTWQKLPPATRLEFDNSSLVHERLVKWDVAALDVHLEWAEKLRSDAIVAQLMNVTGGWPLLIDEVFRRCGDQADPRESANELERELKCDSKLRQAFLQALGLDVLPRCDAIRVALSWLGSNPFETELWREILTEDGVTEATPADLLDFLRLMQVIEPEGSMLRVNPQVAWAIAEP